MGKEKGVVEQSGQYQARSTRNLEMSLFRESYHLNLQGRQGASRSVSRFSLVKYTYCDLSIGSCVLSFSFSLFFLFFPLRKPLRPSFNFYLWVFTSHSINNTAQV